MPLIEADFTQDYEDKPAPEGRYDLRVIKATDKVSKNGNDMVELMLGIEGPDGDGCAPIFHYLVLPNGDTDEKVRRMFMQNVTRFLAAFDVPHDKKGFNTEDMMGCTAKDVAVIQEERDDMPGSISNKIKLPPISH